MLVLIWVVASRDDEESGTTSHTESAPNEDAGFEHANWNLADKPRQKTQRPPRPARLEGVEIAMTREQR